MELKPILVAGLAGALIVFVFGNVLSSVGQQVFPTNPMFSTAATGFGIGVGVQIAVRALGVS